MSLYRKYRPLDFSSLEGQDHIREILLSALSTDRVSHAYLFTGPRGTGKTSTARIMARAINCLALNQHGPCNACDICKAALDESLTDFVEIDAASHGLVDDARALVEQARFMPTQAKKKIYIIDEVHMLSKSAFNALLKIIEEPPEHVHFILATTEAHKVLDTIKSRCQRFDFHLADIEMITSRLRTVCELEKAEADEDALQLLAQHARGSFRDALSLLEQVIGSDKITLLKVKESLGLSDQSAVDGFLTALTQGEKDQALQLLHQVHEQGMDLYQFCQTVLEQLRERLLKEPSALLLSWIDIFFLALDQLKDSFLPELPLELAVLKCVGLNDTPRVSSPSIPESAVKAPRKIVEKEVAPEIKPPQKEVSAVADVSSSDGSFDTQKFIASISNVPLRSLLKLAKIEMGDGELRIEIRTPFELDKIREPSNLNHLTETLNQMTSQKTTIKFGIQEQNDRKDLPSRTGLSNNDLQSVFS